MKLLPCSMTSPLLLPSSHLIVDKSFEKKVLHTSTDMNPYLKATLSIEWSTLGKDGRTCLGNLFLIAAAESFSLLAHREWLFASTWSLTLSYPQCFSTPMEEPFFQYCLSALPCKQFHIHSRNDEGVVWWTQNIRKNIQVSIWTSRHAEKMLEKQFQGAGKASLK